MKTAQDIAAMDAELEQEMLSDEPPAQQQQQKQPAQDDDDTAPDFEFAAEDDSDDDADADTGQQQRAAPKKQRMVPHEALHRTREELNRLRSEREQERLRAARLEERMEILSQALAQTAEQEQQAKKPAVPKAEEDPLAVINYLRDKFEQQELTQAERAQAEQARAEEARQQQAENQFYNQVIGEARNEWQQFVAENPQAEEAYQHVLNSRASQLRRAGYPENQINLHIQQEEAQLAVTARRLGKSIADMIMGYAEDYGWRPDGGKQRYVEQNKARLTKLQKTADAAASLSTSGGGAPGKITLDSLDRMDNKEFHNLVKSLYKKGGEEAMDAALEKMMQ